ncbi:conserved Plasmodium protein, unknown function [Plasmodium yoelii]|uniref:Uncharacterized protein n=4 Tax=Plasmodium yoelii TaxID=5861 RepID=A0AAE9WIM2_PLAYO|nr:conserved Plasmodium protein, unknown function [Plasmodium yoelii]WBY54513.1 hypothetical protein Py17XNL_000104749 [Plasmodium yoelii yoelii]CDU15917.1 conserved Plasmodium protein, unknown function [Plasmodium yoelii]VTZ71512.1 conserved Plasmodium protein, unknown function [Plasmodium yoelii]|eukprot:XP_022811250.1 conserved Plasmodium protein, unknown function [Plasmodium yoelii]
MENINGTSISDEINNSWQNEKGDGLDGGGIGEKENCEKMVKQEDEKRVKRGNKKRVKKEDKKKNIEGDEKKNIGGDEKKNIGGDEKKNIGEEDKKSVEEEDEKKNIEREDEKSVEKGNDEKNVEESDDKNDEKNVEENDEKNVEESEDKNVEENEDKNVEESDDKNVEENDNSKCNDCELQNKKLRSCGNNWKGSNTFSKLFENETNDYIKYNTSPGLLERSENINDKQNSKENSKGNICYQLNKTDQISMYNFNPYQLGYRPNNGLNPSQGYVFIYPHTTKNSKPPKIRKKKLSCC